jgi:hypothetical protein
VINVPNAWSEISQNDKLFVVSIKHDHTFLETLESPFSAQLSFEGVPHALRAAIFFL